MISIEQVLLLEEKVESAVKKIEQLNAENAALRNQVAELTDALHAKSEQFSSFQTNQGKIEEGILKALSRLNAVENVVLNASQVLPNQENQTTQSEQPSEDLQTEEPSDPPDNPSQTTEEIIEEPFEQTTEDDQAASELDLVSEIEVPVSESPEAAENTVQEDSFSETLTPDIDFEFGESDSSSQPESPEQPSETSEESQPLFDIF